MTEKSERKNKKTKSNEINIISHNINGVGHRLENLEFVNFLEDQLKKNVKILGFSETNMNWHVKTTYKEVNRPFKSVYIKCKLLTSTSPVFIPGRYKAGGIMIGMSRKILSQKKEQGSDKYGRWAWARFNWKKGEILLFLQLYLPEKKFGLNTTATQQFQAILRDKPDDLPDIRKQYEADLHSFLQK